MMRSSTAGTRPLRNSPVLISLLSFSLLLSGGCTGSLLKMPSAMSLSAFPKFGRGDKSKDADFDDDDDYFETRVETPLLSEYISVQGNTLVALRGVGLVTGLDGTGDDPPPSAQRNQLREEMTVRGIPNPNEWLKSKNTAMVLVTAYLPPMVRKGQTFDVRVMLPPNSEATSLKGGYLVETRLVEEQLAGGRLRQGHEYAVAAGAIVTAFGASGTDDRGDALVRRGSIPGGAVSKTERDLEVVLRNDKRSFRNSTRIAAAISERFHHYNRFGERITLAEPKTDSQIKLQMHPNYRNNFPRYQQVIRSIAFKETDVARRMRLELLARQVLEPETAASSALQLEAVGPDGIPFLLPALDSDSPEVRFHAAMALAYQEDSSGVEILKQAAMDEPAFRVYALAALSVIKDARAIVGLRELLDSDTMETRYGAVRALTESAPNDPSLGTVNFPDQFIVHEVRSNSAPMVHVLRYRSPEISIFGTEQKLLPPLMLKLGNKIRLMGEAGDPMLTLSKYEIGREPVRVPVSPRLIDVIHAAGELGATYPDIVEMLVHADLEHNLQGEFGIDQLPQAGRQIENYRFRRDDTEDDKSPPKKRVGSPGLIPDLFDRVDEELNDSIEAGETPLDRMFDPDAGTKIIPTGPRATPADVKGDSADSSKTESPGRSQEDGMFDLSEPGSRPAGRHQTVMNSSKGDRGSDVNDDQTRRSDDAENDDAEMEDVDMEYVPRVEEADFRPSIWQRLTAPFRNISNE
ncbi:MAG: flagellar basal body P-ring protein FlgI [Planctomycetaceae bacterium]